MVVGSWLAMVVLGYLNSLEPSKMGVIDMGLGGVEMRIGPECGMKKNLMISEISELAGFWEKSM